jgi:hypothetical protein
MDGIAVESQIKERRPECLLMSSTIVQKLMRGNKTRGNRRRAATKDVMLNST